VVDAITPLLGPLLSAVSAQGHVIMDGLMRELRALAQKHFLSVLVRDILLSYLPLFHSAHFFYQVINNTTSSYPSDPQSVFNSTIRKPALGPSFTALTDVTLWLSQYNATGGEPMSNCDDSNTIHVAEVLRSRTNVTPVRKRFTSLVLQNFQPSNTWCSFKICQGKFLSL
jgi:RAD51-like protein 3